jgi:hypothetical protein
MGKLPRSWALDSCKRLMKIGDTFFQTPRAGEKGVRNDIHNLFKDP